MLYQFVEKRSEDVILSPFALRLRTALSEAKGLRVNSAKDLLLRNQALTRLLVALRLRSGQALRLLGMTGGTSFSTNG